MFIRIIIAIALTLGQQAMSNDKPLRVYALFLRFSAKRHQIARRRNRSIGHQSRCSV
ncbi:hypothetical protein [Nostoc sp. DSM 114160]